MLSNKAYVYMQLHSTCYYGSIIPIGFKFTKSHALTLAAHSYALLL